MCFKRCSKLRSSGLWQADHFRDCHGHGSCSRRCAGPKGQKMGSKLCWVCNQINTVLPTELHAAAAFSSSHCHPEVHMPFPSPLPFLLWHRFKFCIEPGWSKLGSPQVSRIFCTALLGPPARHRGSRARCSTGASEGLPTQRNTGDEQRPSD